MDEADVAGAGFRFHRRGDCEAELSQRGQEGAAERSCAAGNAIDADSAEIGERSAQEIGVEMIGVARFGAPGTLLQFLGSRRWSLRGRVPADVKRLEIGPACLVPGEYSSMGAEQPFIASAHDEIGEPAIDRHHAEGMADIDK